MSIDTDTQDVWNKETINLKFSYAHFPIDDDDISW
jgi:hypothetical protein